MDQEKLISLASAVRLRRYNLLLGAGVSRDSSNEKGPLKTAKEFRQALCRLKGLDEGSSLQRAFETLGPEEIESHVTDVFKNCSPGPSVRAITKIPWKRIFTLNIDDALDAAYEDVVGLRHNVTSLNFTSKYTEPRGGVTPIIHLHGWTRRPNDGYVFSTSAYARNMATPNAWMFNLAQFIFAEPFIIMGSSLEEVDFEYYLAQRSPDTLRDDVHPSVIVEPFPDAATISQCERRGLVLFQGTALEFLGQLSAQLELLPPPDEFITASQEGLFPKGTGSRLKASFFSDFELVPSQPNGEIVDPRFLYGHPPSWSDLALRADVARQFSTEAIADLENYFERAKRPELFLLLDDAGTGKSTVLRRVGFEFARAGIVVLLCSSLSKLSSHAAAEAIDLIDNPVLILADNVADQAGVISELTSRLEKNDVAIFATDRTYRASYLFRSLMGIKCKIWDQPKTLSLSFTESENLIKLFEQCGLVGALAQMEQRQRFASFLLRDPIALAACRILNDFHPLERIIKSLCDESNEVCRRRFFIVSLSVTAYRGGVPADILISLTGTQSWSDQFTPTHALPLADEGGAQGEHIVPLNPSLAEQVFQEEVRQDKFDLYKILIDVSRLLAPRVSPKTIAERTPEARLASRLFDYDLIIKRYVSGRAEALYKDIKPYWSWNSRYWDQVALMKLDQHFMKMENVVGSGTITAEISLAAQHARHAVNIERHPITLSTLGRILMEQCILEGVERVALFDEGFARLAEAIERERRRGWPNVQPYITLFRGVRHYMRKGGVLTRSQSDEISAFIIQARNNFGRYPEVERAIEEII